MNTKGITHLVVPSARPLDPASDDFDVTRVGQLVPCRTARPTESHDPLITLLTPPHVKRANGVLGPTGGVVQQGGWEACHVARRLGEGVPRVVHKGGQYTRASTLGPVH